MITFEDNIFRISCKDSVYAVAVKDSRLHHLFFLPRRQAERVDVDALMLREPKPEAEIHANFEERHRHHGATTLGSSVSARAIFAGHTVEKLANGATRLTLTTTDEVTGLSIDHRYDAYEDTGVLTRSVALVNTHGEDCTLQHVSSFQTHGMPFFAPVPGSDIRIHSFPSSWCWEGQMRSLTAEQAGLFSEFALGAWRVESTGSWSCKEYAPFFIIEEAGAGVFWAMQIEHSASWRFEVAAPGTYAEGLSIQGGLGNYTHAHWSKQLRPGERFESIPVSLACAEGTMDTVSNRMHHHRARHQICRSVGDSALPVIFNEWLSTQGAVCEATVQSHMESLKGSGVEIYAMDSGWFLPEQLPEGTNWYSSVGDWTPSRERFPNGLRAVTRQIEANGMLPGIWVETEVAAEHSEAYGRLGDMLMRIGGRYVQDNGRRFLNFGEAKTRAYVAGVFENLIEAGIRYFKIDYNCDCGIGCTNGGDSPGQGLLENIRGYYATIEGIRAAHPDIILENCSSGGNRLDYGMLARSDLASITDQASWKRLGGVFYGVSRYVHPSQMGNWSKLEPGLAPNALCFSLVNSMLGRMHLSGEVEALDDGQRAMVAEAIRFYKAHRQILQDPEVYHHTPNPSLQYAEGWAVLQMNGADGRILLAAWRHRDDDSRRVIRMRGVDTGTAYSLATFPAGEAKTFSGQTLADGIEICLEQDFSAVIYAFSPIE